MAKLVGGEPTTRFSTVMESEITEGALEEHTTPEVAAITDEQLLVARVLRGDTRAFDEIFEHYSGLMFRTAYSIMKDRDLAEDAVQNALIQAWQHISSLRETGALRPWLLRIVVNQCISFKRRLARSAAFLNRSVAEQETDIASQVADDAWGRTESYWDIAQALAKLSAQQRIAITLHYYQGMTLPEMSQKLHISENTLKKRVQAALTNLRRVLRYAELPDDH
jgi:RNA polymerase sigma-70 factor, ECF subfamily